MYGSQIECILASDPLTRRTFVGCFSIDQIPKKARPPLSFVINSDPANGAGEHWLSVWRKGGLTVFFDSLGMPPSHYSAELDDYIRRDGRSWTNNVQWQSSYSNVCGQYCIHAIQTLERTQNPNYIVRPFTSNRVQNDKWIARRFKKLISRHDTCALHNVQISIPPIRFL